MSKKSRFGGPFNNQQCPSSVELCVEEPLSNWLIVAKESELEKDSLIIMLNLGNFLTPIQMQLSGKEKTFSHLFAAFLKSRFNFKDFEKKGSPS